MYRDFSQYIATDRDRRVFRQWLLGCAIVYGLPLLYLVGMAAFTHSSDVSQRGADPASIASASHRPALTP
jgi:hypothetical protein